MAVPRGGKIGSKNITSFTWTLTRSMQMMIEQTKENADDDRTKEHTDDDRTKEHADGDRTSKGACR